MLDINPTDLLNKFDGTVMGKETAEGRTLYKIRLISKPEKGKQVRENTLDLMAQRMKELHQTLRAQELLLDYAAAEQKFLRELLIEIHDKKKLNEADGERILAAHERLLAELSRRAKK